MHPLALRCNKRRARRGCFFAHHRPAGGCKDLVDECRFATRKGETLEYSSVLTISLTPRVSFQGMFHNQRIKRIGASGVVYGWMGMRLATSWLSPYHRRMDALDFFYVVLSLAYEFRHNPLTIDDLRLSTLMESDGIDHQAHIMGALFGIIFAVSLIQWDKLCDYLKFRRGAGRRLGSRWEDEQRIRQREADRRRNSRLINDNASNASSRRRERTML